MTWWARYRGRCTGRVLHFLHAYCGLDVAEQAVVDCSKITYRGLQIATFGWSDSFGQKDVPVFAFLPVLADGWLWAWAQAEKQEEAIESAVRFTAPVPEGRAPVDIASL